MNRQADRTSRQVVVPDPKGGLYTEKNWRRALTELLDTIPFFVGDF